MKFVYTILLTLLFTSCVTSPEKQVRKENIFFLNGNTVEVADEELHTLRSHWKATDATILAINLLSKSDIQWILDYISISETVMPGECKTLQLLSTGHFDTNDPTYNKLDIQPGLFDYAWDIDACGSKHTYRIVNEKYKPNFTVYPAKI